MKIFGTLVTLFVLPFWGATAFTVTAPKAKTSALRVGYYDYELDTYTDSRLRHLRDMERRVEELEREEGYVWDDATGYDYGNQGYYNNYRYNPDGRGYYDRHSGYGTDRYGGGYLDAGYGTDHRYRGYVGRWSDSSYYSPYDVNAPRWYEQSGQRRAY